MSKDRFWYKLGKLRNSSCKDEIYNYTSRLIRFTRRNGVTKNPTCIIEWNLFYAWKTNQKWKCWEEIEGLLLVYEKNFIWLKWILAIACSVIWLLPDFLQVWISYILLNLRTWIAILQKGCHYFYLFMFNSLHNVFTITSLQWIILKNHLSTC